MDSNMIYKVILITTLDTSDTDVLMENIITVMLGSYDSTEVTLNHMKNINLASFPNEKVSNYFALNISDAERMDSVGFFKP